MSDSARIHNLEALKDARHALATFSDEVSASLASVDADILKVAQWLKVEWPTHWKLELRRRQEEVQKARAEIMRKRTVAAPEPAGVSLEERRLERSRLRLEEAKRKLDKVRRWVPVWEREAMLYKSSTRSLTQALHADIPRAMAALANMMESLDQYADVPRPEEPLPAEPPPERRPEQERPQ